MDAASRPGRRPPFSADMGVPFRVDGALLDPLTQQASRCLDVLGGPLPATGAHDRLGHESPTPDQVVQDGFGGAKYDSDLARGQQIRHVNLDGSPTTTVDAAEAAVPFEVPIGSSAGT